MYAVIRIRGCVHVAKRIRETLGMLCLRHVNNATLVPQGPVMEGMLKKVKDFVTWGEVSKETVEQLLSKRGRKDGKRLEEKEAKALAKVIMEKGSLKAAEGLCPVFRLSPPRKGFRSVRLAYPKGDLGSRGEKINELIGRMV